MITTTAPQVASTTNPRLQATHQSLALARLSFGIVALLIAGCHGAINQKPFKAYSEATIQLRTGANAVLDTTYDWSREAYIEAALAPTARPAIDLQITEPDGDPYGWQLTGGTKPLPWQISGLRSGVDRLNSSLVDYANLLMELASDELVSTEEFDQLASNLNDNLASATKALNLSGVDSDQLALFSTAASALARQYIESKRRESLRQALVTNQSSIEAASALGASAAEIAAQALRRGYSIKYGHISRRLLPPNQLSQNDRKTSIEMLMRLDETFIGQLSALRSIATAYATLPGAHRELAKAADSDESTFEQIRNLYNEGRRLQKLYDELRKENDESPKTAPSLNK